MKNPIFNKILFPIQRANKKKEAKETNRPSTAAPKFATWTAPLHMCYKRLTVSLNTVDS